MYERSARLYDALYAFKDYRADVEYLCSTVELSGTDGRELLDVACGTGGHLVHLAAHYTAQGLDASPAMLEVAREKLPGIPLHQGDMRDFDLGERFDVITCLCSSIGYVATDAGLRQAVAAMAAHLRPGGALVVEPFFRPDQWTPGRTTLLTVDEPELKVARASHSRVEGMTAIIDYQYLVATPVGIEHLTERHRLGLFTDDQYMNAFRAAGLRERHDPQGFGRGLYIGIRPDESPPPGDSHARF